MLICCSILPDELCSHFLISTHGALASLIPLVPDISQPHYQTDTVVFLPCMSLMLSAVGWRYKIFLHREPGRNWLEVALWDTIFSEECCDIPLNTHWLRDHFRHTCLLLSFSLPSSRATLTSSAWIQSECQFGFRAPSELHWTWISTESVPIFILSRNISFVFQSQWKSSLN